MAKTCKAILVMLLLAHMRESLALKKPYHGWQRKLKALQQPHLGIATTPSYCANRPVNPVTQAACAGKQTGTLLPYPDDCTQFLICDCVNPSVQQCPPGLYFNGVKKVCDWPGSVVCGETGGGTGGGSSGETGGVTEDGPGTVTDAPTSAPGTAENPGGVTEAPTSAPGTEENPGAVTEAPSGPEPDNLKPTQPCDNQPAGSSFPIKTNCLQYIYCIASGQAITLPCPPGNYFDPTTGLCGPGVSPTACQQ